MNKCCVQKENIGKFYPFHGGCEIKCWHCGFKVFCSSYQEALQMWQSAQQSVQRMGLLARIGQWFGAIEHGLLHLTIRNGRITVAV